MRKTFGALIVASALLAAPALTAAPGAAQSLPSKCPAMTDSITRLYQGYFGRDPDTNGFRHWVSVYQSGEMNLVEISDALAHTDEFADKLALDDRSFVDWVYATVAGPEVDTGRSQYWVRALEGGHPRGSMMLTFTESREFVARTGTAVPLAGYLRWYPQGSHWYCNIGPTAIGVEPLVGDLWADYYFHNRSDLPDPIALWTSDDAERPNVTMITATLEPQFSDYDWDGEFTGNGNYGRSIVVKAGPSTDWIVVFYPQSVGTDRLGWQIN